MEGEGLLSGGGPGLRRRRSGGGGRAGGGGAGRGALPPWPQHGLAGSACVKMDPLSLAFSVPSAERAFQLHYSTSMLKVRQGDRGARVTGCVFHRMAALCPPCGAPPTPAAGRSCTRTLIRPASLLRLPRPPAHPPPPRRPLRPPASARPQADAVAFLVHGLLLAVGLLSPWNAPHLTAKQACQSLAAVLPLPLLAARRSRQWYARHRDTLLWLLRLYTLCFMHIRMGGAWGAGAAGGGAGWSAPAVLGLQRMARVYAWLALSSVTWQLRFSHHLPVTVLAHAVNVALCGGGSGALECGLLGMLLGSLYLLPTLLLVYCMERRARRIFSGFLPYWEG